MKIVIETIPHNEQRYETLGDYFWKDDTLFIKVSKSKEVYEEAVAIHELVEALLCKNGGIKEEDITKFDIEFEKTNKEDKEPGDDINSPYHKEHSIATAVERMYLAYLGIHWQEYDSELNKL